MQIPYLALCTVVIGTWSSGHGPAWAQNYPSKPVRIVTAEPGGGNDLASRLIAQGLTASLGQQVIVDNRGGSGLAAGDAVYKAQADGHTLLLYGSTIWLLPFMRDNVPYDPVKDFLPITMPVISPNIIVVHPSVAAGSVKELIALAKSKPGELNYASSGTGAATHLAAELFKAMAGVNIVRVPYRGSGPALNALISGQVQMMVSTTAAGWPHVKSGRLKALAVTTSQPTALAPGLATVATTGLPGYQSATVSGVFAPARTPAAIISRLNDEIVRVLKLPEVKERFFNAGVEIIGSTPEQLAATVKSEMTVLGKLIKDVGIREE